MNVLGLKTYDFVVELERETFHERELKRWWISFSSKDRAYIKQFLKDATSLFRTPLDWHLREAIITCWDLALRCITIGDVDLVPTLEEYDRFLSLPTHVSRVYRPLTRSCFRKRLAKLLGLKTPVMDALTRYGSGWGGSILFNFLLCWFGEVECPATYRGDFVDLEEHWTFYRRQTFMVAFFGSMLFPFQLGSISFAVLPLVSTLPHNTSYIPSLIFETIRSLSLCRETGSGKHGCCVDLL